MGLTCSKTSEENGSSDKWNFVFLNIEQFISILHFLEDERFWFSQDDRLLFINALSELEASFI